MSSERVRAGEPPSLVIFHRNATRPAGRSSSHWYNNFIYEPEITKGLNVFRLSDPVTASPIHLDHLNPQTQEFSLPQ